MMLEHISEHISEQEFLDNHKTELVKIAEIYIKIRLFHEGKCITHRNQYEYIRHKYSKMIQFKHIIFAK
jgi:hypothetical protein